MLNDTTPAGHTASNPASNPGGFDVTDPSINLQAPTRTGYTFLGWYADAGLTTPISSINPATAVNYTVYAKWSAPNAYNVQWTLNDTVPAGLTAVNPNASLTSYTVEDADYTLRRQRVPVIPLKTGMTMRRLPARRSRRFTRWMRKTSTTTQSGAMR